MMNDSTFTCPDCDGTLKYYDRARRIVRTKGGKVRWEKVDRFFCTECGSIHRKLPSYLLPYKHYEANIIRGFISGQITMFDIEYEDYPCEMTISRWKEQGLKLV